jgi:hypothetical protein
VLDLAEQPRPALRGAADHQRVGAGGVEHLRAFSGEVMSPLAMIGNARLGLDAGDGVVFGWPV